MASAFHILGVRHLRRWASGALLAGGILFVIGFGASGALMGIRDDGMTWGVPVLAHVAS
ncbi:MAG TPA: hypothetical protein VEJ89_02905 [Myxococcaceae bacterium]|jgi:hypothetical protein|nr:hypothetical protein [Myxococcaceae bacterium]